MFFSFFPLALISIATMRFECSISMVLIPAKHSLVDVFIRKFKNSNAMFHSTAPIALILSTRDKKIMTISMDFIHYKATIIFFLGTTSQIYLDFKTKETKEIKDMMFQCHLQTCSGIQTHSTNCFRVETNLLQICQTHIIIPILILIRIKIRITIRIKIKTRINQIAQIHSDT